MNEQEIKLPELPTLSGLEIAITFGPGFIGKLMQSYARVAVRMNQQCPELNTPERRPFDLEAAKRGEPLVTREGKEAKFIAHVPDARNTEKLLYLVGDIVYATGEDGYSFTDDSADLFMAPKPKRTVWANTYYHDTEQRALAMSGGAALVAVPVQIDA